MARISLVSKSATQEWHAYNTATSLCPEYFILASAPLAHVCPGHTVTLRPKAMQRSCPALAEVGMLGNRVHTLHCSHQDQDMAGEHMLSSAYSFFLWNKEHTAETEHLCLIIHTPYLAPLQLFINASFLLLTHQAVTVPKIYSEVLKYYT